MKCPKFFRDIITEPNSDTVCIVRVIALAGFFQFFGLASWNYHQHGVFDPQAYALGFAAMLAGAGAALGFKKDTPPEQKP